VGRVGSEEDAWRGYAREFLGASDVIRELFTREDFQEAVRMGGPIVITDKR